MSEHPKNKKQVVFFVQGGANIGLGHISRCVTLMHALPDTWQGTMIVDNINKLNQQTEKWLKSRNVPLCANLATLKRIDCLILDPIFIPEQQLVSIKKKYCCKVVAMDEFNFDLSVVDIFINLYNHINQTVNVPKHCIHGLKFAIIMEQFQQYRNCTTNLEAPKNIAIMMGGADPNNFTLSALNEIELAKEKYNISVILGPLNPHVDSIKIQCLASSHQITIIQNPTNLPEIMKNADFAICGCSTSFFEFSYLGKPSIIVSQNDKEHKFARWLQKQKLCFYFDNNLKLSIQNILDTNQRVSIRDRAFRTFDGNGGRRILEAVNIKGYGRAINES